MFNTVLRLQGLAKQFSTSALKYKFKYNASMIPHPSKAGKGGEDALFVEDNLLVVADGVGGWAQHGIDPGIFSKKLCSLIGEIYTKDKEKYYQNPGSLIPKAVSLNRQVGTSTICILALHPKTGKLSSSYIGDSVYSIFRKTNEYKLFFQAEEHQRQFNFPYQVGTEGDNPNESVRFSTQAQVDDIIIVGSDGLWDNLSLPAIENIVNSEETSKISQVLARTTYAKSLSIKYDSPFSIKAKKAGLHFASAGKPDDITVISARVIQQ